MKTPEEIKKGLEYCASEGACISDKCEYYAGGSVICLVDLTCDALEYINELEIKVPKWISVEYELPKEEGKYIVCTERGSVYCTRFYKGGGCEGIFKTDTNTHITYWMPLPKPPKEGE